MPCYVDPPSETELEYEKLKGFTKEVGLKYRSNNTPYRNAVQEMSRLLCSYCKNHDVRDYSLELQIWWRDHQLADARHKREEAARKKRAALRKQALAKLTDAERKALGVD